MVNFIFILKNSLEKTFTRVAQWLQLSLTNEAVTKLIDSPEVLIISIIQLS